MLVWIWNCTVTGCVHQLSAVLEKFGQCVAYRGWALPDTEYSHLLLKLMELSTCLPIKIVFDIVKASVLKVW